MRVIPSCTTGCAMPTMTMDAAKRNELYAKAVERITDQVYWLPMFTFVQNYAFTDQLAFTPSADELVRLYRVHWN